MGVPGADPRPNPPAHVMHMAVLGLVSGFPWANTFWVRNGNAQTPSQADFTNFTGNFATTFQTYLLPHLSNQLHTVEVTGLYYGPTGGELAAAVSFDHPGGKTAGAMPMSVSCCIGWRVQAHYRGGHPRTYLAGIPSDSFANPRQFLPAYVAGVASSAADFHTAVNNNVAGLLSSLKLGTVSFINKKQWREPPVFRDFITASAHVDPRIDSQRRRLGRDIPP